MAGSVVGETAAVKFVPSHQIDGQKNNKPDEHRVNQDGGRALVDPQDQTQARETFHIGKYDGDQVY